MPQSVAAIASIECAGDWRLSLIFSVDRARISGRVMALGCAAMGIGNWAALLPLSPANAQQATVTEDLVRFGPDIEPIVKLIEETPREKCVAMLVEQFRKGSPYRIVLAALYLANIRISQVGHPLATIHSAHDAAVRPRAGPAGHCRRHARRRGVARVRAAVALWCARLVVHRALRHLGR
jgi:hypothetical protein